MLTEFSQPHQKTSSQRRRFRFRRKRYWWVGWQLFVLLILGLTAAQANAQETIAYETYLARISRFRTEARAANSCADFAAIADDLETITAVTMPNGSVMQVQHEGAAQAIRRSCNFQSTDSYLAGLCPPTGCQPNQIPQTPSSNDSSNPENTVPLFDFSADPNHSDLPQSENESPNSLEDQGQENNAPDGNNQQNNPNGPVQQDNSGNRANGDESSNPPPPLNENGSGGADESANDSGEQGNETTDTEENGGDANTSNDGAGEEQSDQSGDLENAENEGETGNSPESQLVGGEPNNGEPNNGEPGGTPPDSTVPNSQNPEADAQPDTAVSEESPAEEQPSFIEKIEESSKKLSRRTLIIIAIVTIILILIIGILAILFLPSKKKGEPEPKKQAPTTIQQELVAGRQKVKEGEYREAVRKLFLAALLTLDERGAIQYNATLTNYEILRHAILRPSLIKPLLPVISTYERVWYGFEPLKTAEYDSLVQQIEQLRTSSQNRAEEKVENNEP